MNQENSPEHHRVRWHVAKIFERIRQLFVSSSDYSVQSPEFESLTPERKAKIVFGEAQIKSLTGEGLRPIAIFHPPNSTFDFQTLGDGALVCLVVNQSYNYQSTECREASYVFIALVKNGSGKTIAFLSFREDSNLSSSTLITNKIIFSETDYDSILVRPLLMGNTLLDWTDPDATFSPADILAATRAGNYRDTQLSYERLEVMEGGKTVKQKSPAVLRNDLSVVTKKKLSPQPAQR